MCVYRVACVASSVLDQTGPPLPTKETTPSNHQTCTAHWGGGLESGGGHDEAEVFVQHSPDLRGCQKIIGGERTR